MSGRARWLLALYPKPWRERYGEEMAQLIDGQPFSIQLAFDLMAGAVDARIDPQVKTAVTSGQAGGLMKMRCAGYGPNVTTRDHWLSVGVMIGVTLALTLVWMAAHFRFHDNPYVDALSALPFFAGLALATPFTYLKGRSRVSQVACIGLMLAVITGIFLAAGFVASKI